MGATGWRALSISRDGRKLVWVGLENGTPRLFSQNLTNGEVRTLEGTDQAYAPFFSWDGESIGFFVGPGLFTLDLRPGSRPVPLTVLPNPVAAVWGEDNMITCSVAIGYQLRRISATTGEEETFDTEAGALFPDLLPGGRKAITSDINGQTLWIVDLQTGEGIPLGLRGWEGRYLESGHLLYHVDTDLFVTPFDPDNPGNVAAGDRVLEGVRTEVYGAGQFDVSETGTLVYAPGGFQEGRLVRVGFDGTKTPLPYPPRVYGPFQISPDGTRLAISYESGSEEIVFLDLDRQWAEPLTSNRVVDRVPIWSPDGSALLYMDDSNGVWLPVIHRLGDDPELLPIPESWPQAFPESWSGNGFLSLGVMSEGSGFDVVALELESGQVTEIAATEALEWAGSFSPDGNWIAYTSDRNREYGVYIQSFPPRGEARLVSQGYAEEPIWSRDGSVLFFRSLDRFMAVDVQTEPDLIVSGPREVLRGPYINVFHRSFDVWPDGQSLLLVEPAGEETAASLRMIQGWFRVLQEVAEGTG
jgi:Tol biopolymer transport system component